jgi:hypothetical protein
MQQKRFWKGMNSLLQWFVKLRLFLTSEVLCFLQFNIIWYSTTFIRLAQQKTATLPLYRNPNAGNSGVSAKTIQSHHSQMSKKNP